MKIDHVEISYRCAGRDKTLYFNVDNIQEAKKCFEGIIMTRMNLRFISLVCVADGDAVPHPENIYYLDKDVAIRQANNVVDCLEEI